MPFDSTPSTAEPHDVTIMRKIRDEIALGSWCQGKEEDRHGNRCVFAWWNYFDPDAGIYNNHPIFTHLSEDIVSINDSRKTTKEDMVALLDVAIRKALCDRITF